MEPMASPTRSDLLQTIREKKYRVSADYLLREIAGEYAIIPVGAASQISNAVMVPNDTAVFLWNTFLQPHTISEVVAQAAEEYEAPEKKIQDSVLNFVHDTLKYQLLEEVVSLLEKSGWNLSLRFRNLLQMSMWRLVKAEWFINLPVMLMEDRCIIILRVMVKLMENTLAMDLQNC